MKKALLTAVLAACLVTVFPVVAAEQTVTLDIQKMTCALCPLTVRKAMERVDGVQVVAVDFDTKTATVTFDDSKTTASVVAAASTEVGYPATQVRN